TRNRAAWRIVWPIFVRSAALAMVAIVLSVLAISLGDTQIWLRQQAATAVLYAAAGLVVAALAWWSPGRQSAWRRCTAVLAIAAFVTLAYDSVLINAFQRATVDTIGDVTQVKKLIPPGAKLVSIGPTHHMFVYLYHEHVPAISFPDSTADAEDV